MTAVATPRPVPRRRRPAAALAPSLWLLALPPLALAAPGAQAVAPRAEPGTLTIEHDAPGCIAAGRPARLSACFRPADALARARVYFRAGGTQDWFYIEMSGSPPCLQGALPKPKSSVKRVEYYLAATDRSFAESRTPEHGLTVTHDGRCSAGPMAPVASSASPVVGSATGAAPAGFVTGGGLSPLLLAGGAVVLGGGAAVAVAGGGGGGGDNPTTTTLPPVPTTTTTLAPTTTTTTTTTLGPSPTTSSTTTTTTTSSTTTTTSTTTTLEPCEADPPTVSLTSPTDDQLSGLSVEMRADASDARSGVKEVRFYWQYCPGGTCQSQNLVGSDASAPYGVVWLFPSCGSHPEDRYRIRARSEDNCGNVSTDSVKDVRLIGRGCFRGGRTTVEDVTTARSWLSELSVPGGRGQVVVDGAAAVFPSGGVETFSATVEAGTHRFEATLVDGAGRPGAWRFDLSALGVVAGSLRVVAGEAASTAAAAVVFRLRGRPGERVVFTVEAGRAP